MSSTQNNHDFLKDTVKSKFKPKKESNPDGPDISRLLITPETDDAYHGMKLLMSECITQALHDLKDYHDPSKSRDNHLKLNYSSARFWITREDNYGLFSFEQCCEVLELNPDAIRHKVRKYLVEYKGK